MSRSGSPAYDVDGAVIFDAKEEGERATWRSLIRRGQPISFCRFHLLLLFCFTFISSFCYFFSSFCCFAFVVLPIPFCRFVESNLILNYILFHHYGIRCFVVSCRDFVVLYYRFLFLRSASFFCRFVYLHFVVFSLSLIRERRDALLLALNEESAAKVIAADSSRRIVLPIKIVFNFYLPVQVRALSSLTTKRE